MTLFGRKKKENTVISPHEVKTFASDTFGRSDSNNDGIPDYLQRPEIQSLIKTNKDLNRLHTNCISNNNDEVMQQNS